MKEYIQNNRLLISRLVIPLTILAILGFWLSTYFQRDILINLATDFISIIITVIFVDWVIKQHEKAQWKIPNQYIKDECGGFGHGFISDVVEILTLSDNVFPKVDPNTFSLRSTQLEIIRNIKNLPSEIIEKSLRGFNASQWKQFVEVLQYRKREADKLLDMFASRMRPEELTAYFEFRNITSSIIGSCELFKPFLGVSIERMPIVKDGNPIIYSLIQIKRTTIDLKQAFDSSIKIIETFGYEAREPDIDYNEAIAEIW